MAKSCAWEKKKPKTKRKEAEEIYDKREKKTIGTDDQSLETRTSMTHTFSVPSCRVAIDQTKAKIVSKTSENDQEDIAQEKRSLFIVISLWFQSS